MPGERSSRRRAGITRSYTPPPPSSLRAASVPRPDRFVRRPKRPVPQAPLLAVPPPPPPPLHPHPSSTTEAARSRRTRRLLTGQAPEDCLDEYFFAWWRAVAGADAPEPEFARMTVRQLLEFFRWVEEATLQRVGPIATGSAHVLAACVFQDLETVGCIVRRNHAKFYVHVTEHPTTGAPLWPCPVGMTVHEHAELRALVEPMRARMVCRCIACGLPGVKSQYVASHAPLRLRECAGCRQWYYHARCWAAGPADCPACRLLRDTAADNTHERSRKSRSRSRSLSRSRSSDGNNAAAVTADTLVNE
jgi:hypothetical protein